MKRFTILLTVVLGLFLVGNSAVSANDTDSKFDVSVVKSDKMRGDTSRSWYDLKLTPGEKTTLTLNVTNRDTKSETFDVLTTQAETGHNMVMTAENPISKVQSSVISSLQLGSNILTTPNDTLTIPAGETKQVNVQVRMPSSRINGSWLGGIHLQKHVDSSSRAANGYTNRFNYLVYVQLSNTDDVTKADLSLKGITYKKQNGTGQVNIKLQNDKAGFVSDANSKVLIHQKGQSENVVNVSQNSQSIANGSIFTYQLSTNALKAGKTYVADITIHDNKNNLTWHWTQEFKAQAELPLSGWLGSNPMVANYNWIWWLLAILALIIWLIIVLLRRRRMVDIIEMVAGQQIERRVQYKVYKKMLKEGLFVTLKKKTK